MCTQVAQDDLFSVEDSGRQSRISWGWSGSQAGRDDYLDEELRYDRNTGAITPAPRDDALSPGLLMTPDPLTEDGMMMTTPGTAMYFDTPAVHTQQQQQQQQHPLRDAVQARRAVVCAEAYTQNHV